jgi:nucleoside-diphosphate-sugar epimerase
MAAGLASRLGIELVTLRLFTVYGPRQRPDMAFARYLRAALSGERMPLFGDGGQRRDFTFVGDAAEAALAALERARPGCVLNVAGGRPATLTHALQLLAGALGRSAVLEHQAPDAREPRATAADLGRIEAEVGWRPRVSLARGLAAQAERALALAP